MDSLTPLAVSDRGVAIVHLIVAYKYFVFAKLVVTESHGLYERDTTPVS